MRVNADKKLTWPNSILWLASKTRWCTRDFSLGQFSIWRNLVFLWSEFAPNYNNGNIEEIIDQKADSIKQTDFSLPHAIDEPVNCPHISHNITSKWPIGRFKRDNDHTSTCNNTYNEDTCSYQCTDSHLGDGRIRIRIRSNGWISLTLNRYNGLYVTMKTMPAKISGAPLPSATNVTPATSSLNPSKSEILV